MFMNYFVSGNYCGLCLNHPLMDYKVANSFLRNKTLVYTIAYNLYLWLLVLLSLWANTSLSNKTLVYTLTYLVLIVLSLCGMWRNTTTNAVE